MRPLHRLARFILLAHQAGDLGRRTDEFDVGGPADLGKVGVFAEQAVAGMNRVHVGDFSSGDDRRHVEIAVGGARRANADSLVGKAHMQRVAIGLAINSDRANAEFTARVDDAQRDFTAIGYQYLMKH